VLLCLLRSVERHGFKRVLIVNGHGGNIAALSAFLPDIVRRDRPRAPRHDLFRAGEGGPG
jgi:creatinine amidohydrolase